MRHRAVLLLALSVAACGGGSSSPPAPTPSPTASPGAGDCQAVQGTPALTTTRVASGLESPLDLQAAPGDRARLFVVEQRGRIRVVKNDSVVATPFLDITDRVSGNGGEQGLLGLAFHPRYPADSRFFVNYTDRSGDTHIASFRVGSDPERADAGSEHLILFVSQPFANHNGGGLAFGPDGMLYAGLGDGGSGGDPQGNGQNLGTALGKLLRIDVDHGDPFAVPADNPFATRSGAFPAIWAYGLRNPWRFSFDRATGNVVIGDVGQGDWEEVDVGLAARHGGENYGWNITEGNHCYDPSSGCNTSGITLPVYEYGHAEGCSITGGIVYQGCRMPGYRGTYFFGDYCSAFVRSFRLDGTTVTAVTDWTSALGRGVDRISAFGTDADGEIHIVDHSDGEIYKIVPAP